ncbi:MAG: FAD-binding oxidoreductase, partial [Opitutaceae bacterium]|nr:FAD-binding oxidoreductase [Opitutaceae bacterium]
MRNAAATRRLVALLGGRAATTDAARFAASFDGSKIQAFPDAVVFPRGDGDIAATLRLANRFGVPVTVRGGGTSLTGSATPSRGGWALDLSRWKKIRLDASAGIARAQAGVVTAELQRAAEAAGWCYPPDPASRDYCTLGGNIATNAGGMRGGRHGVTRDYVLALEGFLPTGEKVRWGADTRKFSAGPNLRDLWIGSEGTLGVITAATLRLIPKPAARWTLLAAFKDAETAVAAGHALRAGGVRPEIFEFLDGLSARCAEEFSGAELFPGNAGLPVILLELAGTPAEVAAQQAAVVRWAQQAAVAFREASDGAGA